MRASSTAEVMTCLVAFSLLLTACYGIRSSVFADYKNLVHRERAQLFVQETFEQLEALSHTRMHQNPRKAWELFLGSLDDGWYSLHYQVNELPDLFVLGSSDIVDESQLKIYDEDSGFFTRLERRIFLETIDDATRQITVSVFWGEEGSFRWEGHQQIKTQALYSQQSPHHVLL